MKRIIILLLKITDWLLRIYINEPKIYKKGYFIEGIIYKLETNQNK